MNLNKTSELKDVKSLDQLFFIMPHDLQMHSYRVSQYSGMLCQKAIELGYRGKEADMFSEEELPRIQKAVLFHDIGKLMTPAEILDKAKPLDKREWAIMKRHTLEGAALLKKLRTENDCGLLSKDAFYNMARNAILCHHEWWDGYHFRGEEISLIARICAIADEYDAITVNLSYHPAMPHDLACTLIEKVSGEQFDPTLIEVFRHCEDQLENLLGKLSSILNLSSNDASFALA
jgi:putative two-component system response regulator